MADEYILKDEALRTIALAIAGIDDQLKEENISLDNVPDTGKACYDGMIAAFGMCYELIDKGIEPADVQPVKHGYWTDLNNDAIYHYECSCCKGHTDWHEKFCPNCGAQMDGEQNDD